jgi:hypothetical protein
VPRIDARVGVRWLRLSTDLPMAVREILHRRLSAASYVRTLLPPKESAIAARDDPVPGLLELPLLAGVLVRRLARGNGV